MIKSRHNTFGSWLFFVITFLFLALLTGEIMKRYSVIHTDYIIKLDNKSFYILVAFLVGALLFFLALIALYVKKISIDTFSKTISFKNVITRQTKIYDFTYFDGFIDTFLMHKYSQYKTIGLIKDKKVIRYIDSFWVSNYDELRQSLADLKDIGTYRFGTWNQLKMLLRKPIID